MSPTPRLRPIRSTEAVAALISVAVVAGVLSAAPSAVAAETVQYAYDSLNRLTEVRYPEAVIRYTYDAAGNRLTKQVENLLKLSVGDMSAAEGNVGTTTVVFTVTLSGPSSRVVSAIYATTDGTAVAGSDYVPASGTLVFPPGTSAQVVAVEVLGDISFEGDEAFSVNLASPVNAGLLDAQGVATIIDDDPPQALVVADATVTEGDSGTTSAAFVVSLTSPSSEVVTVEYATADGTASESDRDYVAAVGLLTFNPGTTTQAVTVSVNGDMTHEADETFFVNLSNPTNAAISDGQGVGIIENNDPSPTASVGDCTLVEGDSGTTSCLFEVQLSGPSAFATVVYFDTADGTAVAGSDYVPAAGTLTFEPGTMTQTISVGVIGDASREADENFFLNVRSRTPFAIAANAESHETSAYAIEANGALTEVAGSPFASGTEPSAAALDPSGSFAYVANAGTHDVSGYLIDEVTGVLSDITGSPFASGTAPRSIAIDPGGRFAFVANSGSDDVTVFSIDPATGTLTEIAGSPFAAGSTPWGIATHPSGAFLYVVNRDSNDVSVFTIHPSTGNLTEIPGSPFGAGAGPIAPVLLPSGSYLFVANSLAATVSAYSVDPGTGALTPVPGSPFATGPSPQGLAISPSGRFLYVANTDANVVSAYEVVATGALTELVGSPYATDSQPTSVAMVPSGRLTYVANASAGNLSGYSADYVAGSLAPLPGSPFLAGSGPRSVALTHPADARGTGSITDNDTPAGVSVSINDVALAEGASGRVSAVFAVSLSGPSSQKVAVDYTTVDGTATAGQDYVTKSGTVNIPAGVTSASVQVQVIGDRDHEPDETLFVNLSNATNATISDGQGLATIVNDDPPPPSLSIGDVAVVEGHSGRVDAVFTVSLSAPSNQKVIVDYNTADGTARAPEDYVTRSGKLNIPAGTTTASITVRVKGDTSIEPDETLFVNLSNATNATISDGQGLATIVNDDPP